MRVNTRRHSGLRVARVEDDILIPLVVAPELVSDGESYHSDSDHEVSDDTTNIAQSIFFMMTIKFNDLCSYLTNLV